MSACNCCVEGQRSRVEAKTDPELVRSPGGRCQSFETIMKEWKWLLGECFKYALMASVGLFRREEL